MAGDEIELNIIDLECSQWRDSLHVEYRELYICRGVLYASPNEITLDRKGAIADWLEIDDVDEIEELEVGGVEEGLQDLHRGPVHKCLVLHLYR